VADRTPHNDQPITEPSQDHFGIDPFARTLASSIRKLALPEGTVIALNGPWGSGKSSAVNLVLYYLKSANHSDQLLVVNFACWWFRGEDKLALAFFRELYAGLGASLGKRFKKALSKLGRRLLSAGSMVGSGVDLAGGGGIGTVTAGAMSWLSGFVQQDDTIEKLHAEISDALKDQKKRFLIVIDDIDRLAPDEALLMFRLVKSVGRLPNVIYLLVFDRILAEAIVAERYPTEGPHYLEKIIQAGFDIPEPRPGELRQQFLAVLDGICGSPEQSDLTRFMNIFYDAVAPELRTPRDLNRLGNNLAVSWPPVSNDVDRADFIGLETLRVLRPNIYRALRTNKAILCGTDQSLSRRPKEDQRKECDRLFLATINSSEQDRLRRALMRLFPPLESIWSNVVYGDHSMAEWSRQRRVCSSDHFESYFRFSLGENVFPKEEIDQLISLASDQQFITKTLRGALSIRRSNGVTKAALILDELNLHADRVPDDDVQSLLSAVFKIADELCVSSDEARGFSIGDNNLRIHWLMRRLTIDRFDLAIRSEMLVAANESATIGWLVHFADSAFADYHPRPGKSPEPENNCLTTANDAEVLRTMALQRLREAAKSGDLKGHPRLVYLLYRWRDLAGDSGAEVQGWVNAQLSNDDMIVTLAKAFTSHGWSHSIHDTVAQRTTIINVKGIEAILDKREFRARVDELAANRRLTGGDAEIVVAYRDGWRRQENGECG
jgi:predicted KAP-like P-loop ATPase